MDEANAGMLKRGADAAIPKIKGMTPSPALLEQFPDSQAFAEFIEELEENSVEPGTQETSSPPASDRPSVVPFGDYQRLKLLGQGGMGSVWLARHQSLGRLVALKVMRRDRLCDDEAVSRFNRETAALGRLRPHPHVVLATDARRIDGQLILVMEYCDGLDLTRIIKAVGPLRIADACEASRQIVIGLSHISDHHLIHRDLKPSNVLLTSEGVIRVLDLGMAKMLPKSMEILTELTQEGQALGTPDFMAPEQWRDSRNVDIRTDFYSLGCTLYYLLSGQPPFRRSSVESPLVKQRAHLYSPVPQLKSVRSDVPDELQDLICRLMSKSVEDRPARPADIISLLSQWVESADLRNLIQKTDSTALVSRVTPSAAMADTVRGNCKASIFPREASEQQGHTEGLDAAAHVLRLQVSGTPYIFVASERSRFVTVGRQRRRPQSTVLSGCDFVVRLPPDDERNLRISRQHFRIRRSGSFNFLSDLSKGRTTVNGRKVPLDREVPIQPGDRILLADLVELCVLAAPVTQSGAEIESSILCQLDGVGQAVMLEVSIGDLRTVEPPDECS